MSCANSLINSFVPSRWLGMPALVLASGLILAVAARAETFYDQHVVFDNSSGDQSFYRSEGMVVAPSKLELVDGKFPVDSSGTLPNGKSFATPAEMRAALVSLVPQFARSLVEKLMMYALGRGIAPYDRRTIDQITGRLADQGYPFQTAIYEIVRSAPFQMRRGELIQTQAPANTEEAKK